MAGRRRRPWRSLVLATVGDGATRRRGTDVFLLIVAALVIIVCCVILKAGGHFEQAVLGFLTPPPGGVKWLVSIVWVLGSLGLIVLGATLALLARRPAMARDVALA